MSSGVVTLHECKRGKTSSDRIARTGEGGRPRRSIWSVLNTVAMHMGVRVSVLSLCFQFFGVCISRGGIAGLYDNSMLAFLRNDQTIFHTCFFLFLFKQYIIHLAHVTEQFGMEPTWGSCDASVLGLPPSLISSAFPCPSVSGSAWR